jgi:hypothetical protein
MKPPRRSCRRACGLVRGLSDGVLTRLEKEMEPVTPARRPPTSSRGSARRCCRATNGETGGAAREHLRRMDLGAGGHLWIAMAEQNRRQRSADYVDARGCLAFRNSTAHNQ